MGNSTKKDAETYGVVHVVRFCDPVIIATDGYGGMLVGEREDLNCAQRVRLPPREIVPSSVNEVDTCNNFTDLSDHDQETFSCGM